MALDVRRLIEWELGVLLRNSSPSFGEVVFQPVLVDMKPRVQIHVTEIHLRSNTSASLCRNASYLFVTNVHHDSKSTGQTYIFDGARRGRCIVLANI